MDEIVCVRTLLEEDDFQDSLIQVSLVARRFLLDLDEYELAKLAIASSGHPNPRVRQCVLGGANAGTDATDFFAALLMLERPVRRALGPRRSLWRRFYRRHPSLLVQVAGYENNTRIPAWEGEKVLNVEKLQSLMDVSKK